MRFFRTKCMREIASGEEITGFRSAINGRSIELESTAEFVIANFGDVLNALYPEDGAEPEPEPPPKPPHKQAPTTPKAVSSAPGGYVAPPAAEVMAKGGGFTIVASLKAHDQKVSALAFSEKEPRLLASGSYDKSISLWVCDMLNTSFFFKAATSQFLFISLRLR